MTSRMPTLVAFDLDYTLWDLWIDTHVDPPLKRKDDTLNQVLDRNKQAISFYRDVPYILHRLRAADVVIAAASRTHAPALARECLGLLLVPPQVGDTDGKPEPAIGFFDEMQIFPGSKISHFKKIHKNTGIPYSEMLFFDDEKRNKEVESLGVTFCLVPHGGTTSALFEKGLAEWRKRHPEEVAGDNAVTS